eukprot:5533179-Prymnesium_polylepis.1
MATPRELSMTDRPTYMHLPQTTPYLLGASIRRELPSIDRVMERSRSGDFPTSFPPLDERVKVPRELQTRD